MNSRPQPTGAQPAPRYVSYGGEQVFQQPYVARGTSLYGFTLPIAPEKRALPQAFIDRVFNQPAGGAVNFQMALPFVLLSFQRFDNLASQNPPDNSKGGFSYNEATLWLPVTNKNQPGLNLSYFVPYIFADNHYAIAAGREVYGYPKALGQITLPQSPGDALHFGIATEVIKQFSPTALGEQATLIEVKPAVTAAKPQSLWHKVEDAAVHITEHIAENMGEKFINEAMDFTIQDLFQPKVEMVFLKQFRDAANGELACYQAIIQGAGAISNWHGGAPLDGAYDVTINSYDSHPIATDLGIEAQYRVPGFYVEFSFDILPGRELWKAA